ncbi:hypothetical protein R3P38DRAFT_2760832 [Favolaschia claudopus]|uniref:Uncharacterized protein n=1 Tax=Favolaschia claudopus TaxID=2862362 RepID=A0AAW0DWT8_9AGAR
MGRTSSGLGLALVKKWIPVRYDEQPTFAQYFRLDFRKFGDDPSLRHAWLTRRIEPGRTFPTHRIGVLTHRKFENSLMITTAAQSHQDGPAVGDLSRVTVVLGKILTIHPKRQDVSGIFNQADDTNCILVPKASNKCRSLESSRNGPLWKFAGLKLARIAWDLAQAEDSRMGVERMVPAQPVKEAPPYRSAPDLPGEEIVRLFDPQTASAYCGFLEVGSARGPGGRSGLSTGGLGRRCTTSAVPVQRLGVHNVLRPPTRTYYYLASIINLRALISQPSRTCGFCLLSSESASPLAFVSDPPTPKLLDSALRISQWAMAPPVGLQVDCCADCTLHTLV